MSLFRDKVAQSFGGDLPSRETLDSWIRFELASPPCETSPEERLWGTSKEWLRVAEERCVAICEFVFGNERDVHVEMTFTPYGSARSRTGNPDACLSLMTKHGLRPNPGEKWTVKRIPIEDNGFHYTQHRFSTIVRCSSPGIPRLWHAVMWKDHGTWMNLSPDVRVLDEERRILFHPYDDRGADLFATSIDSLRPAYERFVDWILEFDREKIDKVFNG
jgi:Domain of unknown function (DUF3885)